MRKLLAVSVVLLLSLLSALPVGAAGYGFGWTISASATDPYENTAPLVVGVNTYYLWYVCALLPPEYPQGIAAAEMQLVASDPNIVLAFVPQFGVLNAGSQIDLLLAIPGCPAGPLPVGQILVLTLVPGNYCLGPSAFGNQLVGVDCTANPQAWPIDWIGLDVGGGGCGSGPLCEGPVSLEPESWAGVKSMYR